MRVVRESSWYDPRIEVRASPIHGMGMFAREPIAEGETVVIVGGELVSDEEFRQRTTGLEKYNAIQIDDDIHLLGPGEEVKTAVINHSCDSNLWMADEVTLTARRDIAADEEVTVDYALFTATGDWTLGVSCNCGSSSCRRHVSGRDWRRGDVQQRHRGHLSPFLIRRLASEESAK